MQLPSPCHRSTRHPCYHLTSPMIRYVYGPGALFACALPVLISSFSRMPVLGCFRQKPRRRREYRQHLQGLEKGNQEAPRGRQQKGRHLQPPTTPTLHHLRVLTAGKQQRAVRHQGQLLRRLLATLPHLNRLPASRGGQGLRIFSNLHNRRPRLNSGLSLVTVLSFLWN